MRLFSYSLHIKYLGLFIGPSVRRSSHLKNLTHWQVSTVYYNIWLYNVVFSVFMCNCLVQHILLKFFLMKTYRLSVVCESVYMCMFILSFLSEQDHIRNFRVTGKKMFQIELVEQWMGGYLKENIELRKI